VACRDEEGTQRTMTPSVLDSLLSSATSSLLEIQLQNNYQLNVHVYLFTVVQLAGDMGDMGDKVCELNRCARLQAG
jgi:hypothetical protein